MHMSETAASIDRRPVYNFFRRDYWFGQIDSRPIAAFRIALALILLKDALYHLPVAQIFYSDSGVIPRSAIIELARAQRFSVMDAMPHAWMATLFFLVWIIVLLGLLIGYRTRTMAVLNFLIMLSVHERSVFILTGADTLMRQLSFWAIFLPLAQYYSVDALRARKQRYQLSGNPADLQAPTTPQMAYAFPVRMIHIQVALVYFSTAYLKVNGEVWLRGDVMHFIKQLDTFLLPTGEILLQLPDSVLRLMSYQALGSEILLPFFILSPILQPHLRRIGLLMGVLLHGGIALMMSIPDFSLVIFVGYITLLEPSVIEAFEQRLRKIRLPAPVMNAAQYILAQLTEIPESTQNVILPDAATAADAVADKGRRKRQLVTIALAFTMVNVIWWNGVQVGDYAPQLAPDMPDTLNDAMWYSGLWQFWDMFSPLPLQVDGTIVVPGVFENGETFDLRTGAPVGDKPPHARFGPFMRWKKLEENLFNNEPAPILLAWGRYFCRHYNNTLDLPEGERLATLEIHYAFTRSYPPGGTPNEPSDSLLWKHWCFDEYAY